MSACAKLERTGVSTIATGVVRTLLEVVEEAGVAQADFLGSIELDPAQLDAVEARVSGATVYALCERALELTGDPALGLHWAEKLNVTALVPVSHLIVHSATLRDGYEALTKFNRLLSDYLCHELVERDQTAIVRCRQLPGSLRMQRFASEIIMAFFFRIMRDFDRHAVPERVCFTHPEPSHRAEYARVFGGTECFDQPFTGMVFDRALLDRPAPHKDRDVHAVLQALAERRLLRIMKQTPYALRVRDLLVQEGQPHRNDMTSVARSLGMSVRSLRRRLAAEGTSYHSVASQALATIAKQFLRREQYTIQEIAYEMGFSDARTFHRAFKRWTGITPGAYRGGLREEAGRNPA